MKPGTFWRLTWRLELFTHLIPVPSAIYFSAVAGGFPENEFILAINVGAIGGGLVVVLGVIWRYFRLQSMERRISALDAGSLDEVRARRLKIEILRYPRDEAIVIILRWITGVPIVHILYIILNGLRISTHITIPFVFLLTTPISAVVYLFISEREVRPLLLRESLAHIHVPSDAIPKISYYWRILVSFLAVGSMPTVMLGYVLFAYVLGAMPLEHPLMHVAAIALMMFATILFASWVVVRAVRDGLSVTHGVLTKLGEGDLDVVSERTSADEMGDLDFHLGRVIEKLRSMYSEIRNLNESLEERVRSRTEELKKTLDDVQALKVQQDGDYFLTSLLLEPLASNNSSGSTVGVQFLVHQMKHFTFRKWTKDIGGDICIADRFELKGLPHTVVMNADAMGKSIQGAGGALVLGSVFHAILSRTRIVAGVQNLTPEAWLKSAFIELQKVFESFGGSMLASLVLSLVDEDTGLMYHLNAEHPGLVIYRGGEARFIPGREIFKKIGTNTGHDLGVITVDTFQLRPGDVVIAGSDGRDDLHVASAEEGGRIINEDMNAFLTSVEEGDGELDAIYRSLQRRGSFIDDVSLVRFAFKEDAAAEIQTDTTPVSEALSALRGRGDLRQAAAKAERLLIDHPHPVLYRQLLKTYIKLKEYAAACVPGQWLCLHHPRDLQSIFLASYAMKRTGEYMAAAEQGERIRTRDPFALKNLVNLADVYRLMGNRDRAGKITAEILVIEPQNHHALKLKSLL